MSITLLSNSGKQAGAISSSAGIGVALASDQVVVTAVGDSGGNLKLVTWKVSSNGKVSHVWVIPVSKQAP